MYDLKVEDFVDVVENRSSFDINDMVHICKRHNNPKREYLFVNKYQAKHYPINPEKALELFDELFYEIEKHFICNNSRILIVGFAETATGIAQRVTHNALTQKTLNVVYHLQTTRENINTSMQNINFDEQHSHAVSQKLYYADDIPEYDIVLFIEDEITTGNTIINFINQFKKLNPKANYAVASILNWQNKENEKKYKDLNIDTIYLVKGYIKENLPHISIHERVVAIHEPDIEEEKILEEENNPRTGMTVSEFEEYTNKIQKMFEKVQKYKDEKVAVIGTEENMYLPILLAKYLGKNTTVRSTTRSPISVSIDTNYLINNGIELPGAYESKRVTYLYNIDKGYKTVIIVTEKATTEFKKTIQDSLKHFDVEKVIFLDQ